MLREHLQRQLYGFINTPPIWLHTQFSIQQFNFPQVDVTNFSPTPIPQRIRLGYQMEHACKQLLDQSTEYEVLVHNLPIRNGKQTIGEIDFILRELETGQLIHIELTYKFYIINPKISEPIHQLMGPNKRDMFFTKMEKIKNEQFALLHTNSGTAALTAKGIEHKSIIHQACYKAQLFEPYGSEPLSIRPLNPKCIVGYWLRIKDLQDASFSSFQFYIPFKTQWVVEPHNDVNWTSHYDTLMEVSLRLLKQNAPMVWMKRSANTFEKFFVVWW